MQGSFLAMSPMLQRSRNSSTVCYNMHVHKHLQHSNITYNCHNCMCSIKQHHLHCCSQYMVSITELTDDLKKPIEARIAIGRASLKNYTELHKYNIVVNTKSYCDMHIRRICSLAKWKWERRTSKNSHGQIVS